MFGRKKKTVVLTLYGAAGEAVYSGPLAAWKIPEREVIRLSVQYFDDPEPCHIHRSAVCQRACLEMIQAHLGAEETPVERLGAERGRLVSRRGAVFTAEEER